MQACDWGEIGRLSKAVEVERAGGAAMVLMNTPITAQDLILQGYSVPTIHISLSGRETLLEYVLQAPSPTALLQASKVTYNNVAPEMAAFSSRGPVPVANGAVMKPELTAPGVAGVKHP